MTRRRPTAAHAGAGVASLAFLLLFALGPDFHPYHILKVGDDSVRYRTGAFARFEETWYPREDVRGAAAAVAREHAASPGARIVVDTLPAMSYYLDQEHAIYYDQCSKRFASYARERGARELWSGKRLLATPADLFAYAAPAEELWLVREIDRSNSGTDLARLANAGLTEVARETLGHDGRIELVRLRPSEAAGASRQATSGATVCLRDSGAPAVGPEDNGVADVAAVVISLGASALDHTPR